MTINEALAELRRTVKRENAVSIHVELNNFGAFYPDKPFPPSILKFGVWDGEMKEKTDVGFSNGSTIDEAMSLWRTARASAFPGESIPNVDRLDTELSEVQL